MDDERRNYDIEGVLCDIRNQYWLGLEGKDEAPGEVLECVVFDIDDHLFAFEAIYAAEVIRVPRLVKVPRVQPPIVGAFNLRGVITAALDIRPLLRLPVTPLSLAGRILVVKGERFLSGIVTDGVRDVVALPLETFHPSDALPTGEGGFVRGTLQVGGMTIGLLDIVGLLRSLDLTPL